MITTPFKYLTFIFCFFFLNLSAQVQKKDTPHWVNIQEYNEFPTIDIEELTQGTLTLLYDEQIHVDKKAVYYRVVTKVMDPVGTQPASNITVNYDPLYQSLAFHHITIKRDKQIINKFKASDFQILRKESNADNYIYDGSLTATLNLSDVRNGDIIDYSYSIKGFNPIHKNAFATTFYLNDINPVGKIYNRILSSQPLNYKLINNAPEVIHNKITNLNEYVWQKTDIPSVYYENYTPSWRLIYDTVFITSHKSWQDVVTWGTNIYQFNKPLSSNLKKAIQNIDANSNSEGEKIKKTLNFVQNEIRYLGLESGIGSYKPFSPNKVFKQRFGDCKDKSLLMTTMLNQMNIDCYPMLVNTVLGKTITELLPSQKLFDHCVVKVIDKDKNEMYYDPTITNQGGTYKTTYFPNYEYGLVLKPHSTSFDTIQSTHHNVVEIFDTYNLDEVGGKATLNVKTIYHEKEADNMRTYYKNNSKTSIKKEYESYYANYFKMLTSAKNPEYEDDLKENTFTVYESYTIDSIWQPMFEKKNNITVTFISSSLLDVLYFPSETKRKTELGLLYPSTRKHKIEINLPQSWTIKNEDELINSKGFYYEWNVDYNRRLKKITIDHLLKIQKNYITVNEYDQYLKDLSKLDTHLSYMIYIPKRYSKVKTTNTNEVSEEDSANNLSSLFKPVLIGLFILVCVIAIFLYFVVIKSSKKKH